MLLLTGCVTRTLEREIPTDRKIVSLTIGVPFTPPCEGKFVPEARFNELLDVYLRASNSKTP